MTPIFILPFDHRGSFSHDILCAPYPVSAQQKKQLIAMKRVIFDGFLTARKRYKGKGVLGILVDEEFGSAILATAKKMGIPFAVTTESAVHTPFGLLHGKNFRKRLRALRPTWAKALIYYTVGNDAENNHTKKELKKLSDFCEKEGMDFMLEVLVSGIAGKKESIGAMIDDIEGAGIMPTLWKLEGLESVAAWNTVAAHTDTPMIVLGRGESKKHVTKWLTVAAKSRKTIGIAVGRSTFLRPCQELQHGTIDRATAVEHIAKNYLHFISVWENAASA